MRTIRADYDTCQPWVLLAISVINQDDINQIIYNLNVQYLVNQWNQNIAEVLKSAAMIIQDSRSIKGIQEEFHQIFPGLKMVFYQTHHDEHEGSEKGMEYAPDQKLSDIRVRHTEGSIEILPDMTVRELEQAFEKLFGLHIQIFRRSGAVWLQTIHTDDWTLTKQNEKGIETIKR